MTGWRLASARGLACGGAAAGLGLAALLRPESLVLTALWPTAVLAAAHGYGRALARLTRQQTGPASTVIGGLAVLVVASVALGTAGLLTRSVQLGALALGLAACGLAPPGRERVRFPIAAAAGVAAIACGLAAVAIAHVELVIRDGLNHTLGIKRLWDTGALERLHHQLGAQPVAEAYLALGPGAHVAAVFETAVAPALLIALVLERVLARGSRIGIVVCALLGAPVVLGSAVAPQWSAALWLAAAFFGLCDALEARRTAWQTIACAVAAIATRHEYAIVALPYLAAAIALPRPVPPSRRAQAAIAAGWVAALVAIQIALWVPPRDAAWNAVLLLAAWPLARALLAVLGDVPSPGAVAVLAFSLATFTLALVLEAIRPAQHDVAATEAVWFAAAVCTGALPAWSEPAGATARFRAVAGAALVLCAAFTLIAPNVDATRRLVLVERFTKAMIALDYRPMIGDGLGPHRTLRALQERVPAGAPIAFWGQSAAALDFGRNPIRDVSWPVNRHRDEHYLTPVQLRSLRGRDYILLELVEASTFGAAPWTATYPTAVIENVIEKIACAPTACVFAIVRR